MQALDFSSQMCEGARKQAAQMSFPVDVIEADIFDQVLQSGSSDIVVSSFGLKTFSKDQQAALAKELERVLKPGGEFSFIEISMPDSRLLRAFYKVYINLFIPMIGKFCLGNPNNYRHLGVYTEKFRNSQHSHSELLKLGIESNYFEHFFGCASGVYGRKRSRAKLS
ncbi:MAG: class I SAM-dependent methyltransferase [Deltaproteobacteria bacterium]|nr:class I SAM-dependent methyltransferase [Deltaproteobacteria bacterium]